MTAPIGQPDSNGGSFLERLQNFIHTPVDRPDPAVIVQHLDLHDQATLSAAVVAAQDLVAAPAPALDLSGLAPAASPTPEGSAAPVDTDGGRSASYYLNGIVPGAPIAGTPHSPFAQLDLSVPYMLIGDMQSGLVIDPHTKTLMQGGPGDYPDLCKAPNDTVELNGDYSAGFALGTPDYIEQVVAHAGNNYNLIADDGSVAAGGTLTINAMPLGGANNMIFDGSAEMDGRFIFFGSNSADVFFGGAGNDVIYGDGGADMLSGGAGSDTFAYYGVSQSSGGSYDVLADFNAAVDKIDLDVTVNGFDAAIQGGALSAGSFSQDMGVALAGLGAGHAAFYAPDSGDLAGNIFLIVDANGIAGYQEGEDYVFALAGTTLADLTGHTGFFI